MEKDKLETHFRNFVRAWNKVVAFDNLDRSEKTTVAVAIMRELATDMRAKEIQKQREAWKQEPVSKKQKDVLKQLYAEGKVSKEILEQVKTKGEATKIISQFL